MDRREVLQVSNGNKKGIVASDFVRGIKAGIPIAIGYIPIAVAFGLLAKSSNIPNHISILMSLVVFAGASQFVGIKLMALGTSPWEIAITTFILNFRHFLMSSSLSQRIKIGTPKKVLGLISFGITDETFSVASLQKYEKLESGFILGLNVIAYISWVGGTIAGVFLGSGLPESIKISMGIALYAMFIGLLVPTFRDSKPILIIAIISVTINSIINWVPIFSSLSSGWGIIISTIIAAGLGAFIFPKGVNK